MKKIGERLTSEKQPLRSAKAQEAPDDHTQYCYHPAFASKRQSKPSEPAEIKSTPKTGTTDPAAEQPIGQCRSGHSLGNQFFQQLLRDDPATMAENWPDQPLSVQDWADIIDFLQRTPTALSPVLFSLLSYGIPIAGMSDGGFQVAVTFWLAASRLLHEQEKKRKQKREQQQADAEAIRKPGRRNL